MTLYYSLAAQFLILKKKKLPSQQNLQFVFAKFSLEEENLVDERVDQTDGVGRTEKHRHSLS